MGTIASHIMVIHLARRNPALHEDGTRARPKPPRPTLSTPDALDPAALIFGCRAPRIRPLELFERLEAISNGAAHFDESRAAPRYPGFVHPGFAELKKFGCLTDRKQPLKILLRHLSPSIALQI